MAYQSLAERLEPELSNSCHAITNDGGVASPRGIREIDCLVESLVASWHAAAQLMQNRRWHRTPYRKPLVITPLDNKDVPIAGPRLAVGRDLSTGGLSFLHRHPLPHRIVAITFQSEPDVPGAVVSRLTWCRFTRAGTYQSGGKFLRTIALPELQEFDLDRMPAA